MKNNVEHIREHLAYSTRIDGLEQGHLQELQQLLDDREQLRGEIGWLLDELTATRNRLAAAENLNKQLEAEVTELRNKPTIQTGTYIERIRIDKQYLTSPRRITSRKNNISSPNQLQLWNPVATSM